MPCLEDFPVRPTAGKGGPCHFFTFTLAFLVLAAGPSLRLPLRASSVKQTPRASIDGDSHRGWKIRPPWREACGLGVARNGRFLSGNDL